MTRRDMIKLSSIVAFSSVTASAYDEKLVVNKIEMKPKDPKNLTKGEQKHTPKISVGEKDKAGYTLVEVTVGQGDIIHPSTDKHWIYEISLLADGKAINTVKLEPTISRGYLGTRVKFDGVKELSAIAKCNLHGTWESSYALKVETKK